LFIWLLVWIQPAKALTEIKVEENYIEFQSLITLYQNVTSIQKLSYSLNEDMLHMLNESLTSAIRSQASSAIINNLKVLIKVEEKWLNISLTFKIENVSEKIGSKVIVNCSWKNFQVKDNLTINGLEFNKFGEAYIAPLVKKYENSSQARFWINETHSVSPEKALEVANSFLILDFKEFSIPLEEWNKTYNVKTRATLFQYNAPSKMDFNLTITEENQSKYYIAKLNSKAVASIPGYAKAKGDAIIFIINEDKEMYVAGLISTLILILIPIHLYERKLK
jgi:hypothetical protein